MVPLDEEEHKAIVNGLDEQVKSLILDWWLEKML